MTTGYCPHCGRGDCSPTADQWAEQKQRADKAERAVDHLADRYRGAEDAIARVRALADQWAILRAHGSAAAELRTALDGTA